MNVPNAEQLSREILAAVEQAGQLRNWLRQRPESTSQQAVLDEACVLATETLLSTKPPRTAEWEQLLIQLAVHSHEAPKHSALDHCKSVLAKLHDMIEADRFATAEDGKIVTIAGALTIALTAQRRLRQSIEKAMSSLCEKFQDELAQIGEQCQDIWKRKGQMSGEQGLFLWDIRKGEWRLRQDFKGNRPHA